MYRGLAHICLTSATPMCKKRPASLVCARVSIYTNDGVQKQDVPLLYAAKQVFT
jgi:hypothetical protein